MPDPASDPNDDARSVLQRELYWAGDPTSVASRSTAELRIALHDFVAAMRADERSPIPRREPLLGSQAQWKRNAKLLIYRAFRPVSRRYDRLLGDLATLTILLADRLADAEAEIERLRGGAEEASANARAVAPPSGGGGAEEASANARAVAPPSGGGAEEASANARAVAPPKTKRAAPGRG
jgi:hypothetical protein